MAIHDAPLSNVVQSGNSLKAIAAGDASIGWESVTKIVTFNANGGTCGTASAETGADGKLTSLPTATRDGYAFDGWFTAAESGDKITTDTVFDADATVYAHWTADTPSGDDGKKENNIGLIIGGIVVGVVVIAAVAFFLIRKH